MLDNRFNPRDYLRSYESQTVTMDDPSDGMPGPSGGNSGGGGGILGWLKKLIPGFGDAASSFAQGQADERENANRYRDSTNRALANIYGTQQNSALEALLAGGRDRVGAYGTRQGATTSALANESDEATGRYGIQQNATTSALANQSTEGLARARLGMESGTTRARQSIMGSLMANMQPVSVQAQGQVRGRVPVISGGLSASALSPETRQHGSELSKAALMAQLTGSDVPAATDFRGGIMRAPAATNFRGGILDSPEPMDYTSALLTPPELQGYQQPGRSETIASWLSLLNRNRKPTTPPTGGA